MSEATGVLEEGGRIFLEPVLLEYDCCQVQLLDSFYRFFDNKKGARVSLCYPSSSSLDIYGEGILYALTQLLDLLAVETAP